MDELPRVRVRLPVEPPEVEVEESEKEDVREGLEADRAQDAGELVGA